MVGTALALLWDFSLVYAICGVIFLACNFANLCLLQELGFVKFLSKQQLAAISEAKYLIYSALPLIKSAFYHYWLWLVICVSSLALLLLEIFGALFKFTFCADTNALNNSAHKSSVLDCSTVSSNGGALNSTLNPWFITGYSDGEGSFSIRVSKIERLDSDLKSH